MIIPVHFDKLKSIVHLADVHIRLFRRHEEYELAFDKLYNDIRSKKLEDFVIVLAGDIVHAKTDMSPEMVEVTSKFLKNIADIAPTILIAGNHDCNLANTNRLDALTPLVNNLQHPQLHYIKDSAVVTVADTQFAIMSIFDEHYEWPTAKELTAEHKIALYHGPVHGAVTDINFVITNRHVNVNTFDGFDMVLLGDIHKPAQILKEKNPIIAYPGSLIQQHHGETLDPHGWCLWDVPSRAFEFVHLENDYGYVTLEVYNGQITYPANMPKNARLRLFTGEMDNTDVKKLITTIRNKFNIIEMSVNKNRKQLNVNTSSTHVHDTVDLTDVSVQNKLIHDWLGQKYSLLDDSILVAIEKINKDLNSKIVHDDHSRNINWRPLVFKFSNMFSYGEDNEINFSDMKGLYGIFAANASGKSSIMDAIMFCLYDKTPRAFKGDHILNNRKDSFTCELTFEINHEVFGIKRVGTRKKNGDVKVDASFWKALPDGSKQNLNGEDRRDTNANIRSYVGTYEDFVMTALSSQNSNALFIDKSHSERKDLLIQFMGLNVFDKLFDAAHGESKEISGILKRFKKSDVTDKLVEVHANLEKAATRIDEFESTKELYNSQLIDAETRYKTIYATKRPVPQTSGNWEDLQSKLTIARKKLKTAQEDVAIAEYALTSNKKDLEDVRLEFANYDMGALSEANTKWNELHVLLKKKNAHMSIIDTQINEKINFKAKLEGYKYNSNCAVCVENNRVVIEDIKFVNEELDTLQAGKIIEESVIAKILDELRGLQDDQDRFEEGYQLKQTVYECSQTVYAATTTLQNAKNTLEKAEIVLSKIQDEIDIYKTNEENILYNQSVDAQLQAVHKDIANIKQKVSNVDGELRRLYGDLSVLTAKQVDLKNELKEAEELEITYEAYNHYMMAVGRDGVPYDLMSKAIPQIESEINNILSQIVDFSVSLEVDGKNINGKLSYDNDRIWPLENSSGMERFITSLAIRVALLNASNLPKSNMFIIDEGFGVLDADHLHSMQTLFNLLKTQFDTILIVSHLETARDMVDNLIEIKKDDGYSRISI